MSSARQPRWEVARTDSGFHVRYRSSNGNVLLSSEPYTKRGGAIRCIELVMHNPVTATRWGLEVFDETQGCLIEVREIDERSKP